jgi:hypothetical protein
VENIRAGFDRNRLWPAKIYIRDEDPNSTAHELIEELYETHIDPEWMDRSSVSYGDMLTKVKPHLKTLLSTDPNFDWKDIKPEVFSGMHSNEAVKAIFNPPLRDCILFFESETHPMVVNSIAAADNKVESNVWNYSQDYPVFNIANFRVKWAANKCPLRKGSGKKTQTANDMYELVCYHQVRVSETMSLTEFKKKYDVELAAAKLPEEVFKMLMQFLRGVDGHFEDDVIPSVTKYKQKVHVTKV